MASLIFDSATSDLDRWWRWDCAIYGWTRLVNDGESTPTSTSVFCCHQIDPNLCAELRHKAQLAGVSLTIIDSSVDHHLSSDEIAQRCGDLSRFEIYFCGPIAFSNSLKKRLNLTKWICHASFMKNNS